jgi:membrane protein implicated in regulation of membrane protease activity
MGRKLNIRKRGSTAVLAISVFGCVLFVACIFVLENTYLYVPLAGIALSGILGWFAITHERGAKGDAAKCSVLEIVGKPGIVVRECSPEGKVRIGDVTWSAFSYDGATLRVGEKVTVQDMQELKLAVKAKSSTMSAYH